MSREVYDEAFYAGGAAVAAASARRVVPLLMEWLAPSSAVDVGCGLGLWLAAFRAAGLETILGIDGEHVDRGALAFPAEHFVACDLTRRLDLPAGTPRRFDLALCLEVAEHLPAASAAHLVATLVELAPAILFSAAVPRQGGTCHRNEQWPEYWAALFEQRGLVTVDVLRPRVWDDPAVGACYAQNALVFVEPALLARRPALAPFAVPPGTPLARVHPRLWLEATDPRRRGLLDVAVSLPWAVYNAARRVLRRAA